MTIRILIKSFQILGQVWRKVIIYKYFISFCKSIVYSVTIYELTKLLKKVVPYISRKQNIKIPAMFQVETTIFLYQFIRFMLLILALVCLRFVVSQTHLLLYSSFRNSSSVHCCSCDTIRTLHPKTPGKVLYALSDSSLLKMKHSG